MNTTEKIRALKAEKANLIAQAEKLVGEDKLDGVKEITDKATAITAQIAELEKLSDISMASAKQEEPAAKATEDKPFASLGEQLLAIRNAAKTHIVDERLKQFTNAVGGRESIGSEGGFAIQTDFVQGVLDSVAEKSEIVSRLDRYPVSAASNSAKFLSIDETDVSASVFGGVQMYWASEAATVTATKPKFRETEIKLEKLMGFSYMTEELLEDAPFMSALITRGFETSTERMIADGAMNGDGNGKMLGWLNSGALVTVAKETGQTAATFVAENALKMKAALLPKSLPNAVWVMHPDVIPQLATLKVGDTPIWLPATGISGSMYDRLLNIPIITSDSCAALGSKGDVNLVDLSDYIFLTKSGAAKKAWSMHVEFLNDQECFRLTLRCNGAPKRNAPVTIKNSTQKRSTFVTLAARA